MNEQKALEEAIRRVGACECGECEQQRRWFVVGALYATDWFFPQG